MQGVYCGTIRLPSRRVAAIRAVPSPGLLCMNVSLALKLFLIKHGKCSACKDKPHIKQCGACFNTRLAPEVLEAITALDLAERFKENERRMFADKFEDDCTQPPKGSYFHHVIERKQRLEKLYSEGFMGAGANKDMEKELFEKLIGELAGSAKVSR